MTQPDSCVTELDVLFCTLFDFKMHFPKCFIRPLQLECKSEQLEARGQKAGACTLEPGYRFLGKHVLGLATNEHFKAEVHLHQQHSGRRPLHSLTYLRCLGNPRPGSRNSVFNHVLLLGAEGTVILYASTLSEIENVPVLIAALHDKLHSSFGPC